jgi:hypothetical protein
MTPSEAAWHVAGPVCELYAQGALDPVIAASVEAHLAACADCREQLTPTADSTRLDAIFAEIVDRIDAPRANLVERVLQWLGVRTDIARLLVVTPIVRAAWLLAIAAVLLFALAAASADERAVLGFLAVAPLAPLAGVAIAYGSQTDPVHELGVAAPFDKLRLLLIRATAVLAVSVLVITPIGAFVEDRSAAAWQWLLPALALSAVTLALAERIDITVAAGAVGATWLAIVVGMRVNHTAAAMFGGPAQIVFVIVAVCAGLAAFVGRDRFNYSGGIWK